MGEGKGQEVQNVERHRCPLNMVRPILRNWVPSLGPTWCKGRLLHDSNYRETAPQPCHSELSAGSPPCPSELSSAYDMAAFICKALGRIGCSPSALMSFLPPGGWGHVPLSTKWQTSPGTGWKLGREVSRMTRICSVHVNSHSQDIMRTIGIFWELWDCHAGLTVN